MVKQNWPLPNIITKYYIRLYQNEKRKVTTAQQQHYIFNIKAHLNQPGITKNMKYGIK